MGAFRERIKQQVPGISWRDNKIASLEAELAELKETSTRDGLRLEASLGRALRRLEDARAETRTAARTAQEARIEADAQTKKFERSIQAERDRIQAERERLAGPSFQAQLGGYRELYEQRHQARSLDDVAQWQLPYKLRNYSLAQSHGFRTPKIYQVWEQPEHIDLAEVDAEELVLKSDGGHSGRGVFVLRRTVSGWSSLDGSLQFHGQRPPEEVVEQLGEWHGPYFAEELLKSTTGTAIPEDIKVYATYGKVLQILLMQADAQGSLDRKTFTRRYLAPDGTDLGLITRAGTHNPDIPVPENLADIVQSAEHLSRAVGIPFVRVDLYQTPAGLVLGELTPTPGGRQRYTREHDQHMGREWVAAQIRLERDLSRRRPVGSLYGRRKYSWWYDQAANDDDGLHPSNWNRTARACKQWCVESAT